MNPGYTRPRDLDSAVEVLGNAADARPIAGGTDLMVQLRLGHRSPRTVVDVTGLEELHGITQGARIGAAATLREVLATPHLRTHCPALVEAGELLGGRQIQAAATVGGNLCNASPAAETATPLLVHDAQAVIVGPAGRRELPLERFWSAPGRTSLEAGELLVAIEFPEQGGRSAYRRLELRRSVDIAVVGASARLLLERGQVVDARVAIGAAAPTPRRVPEAEEALVGVDEADLPHAIRIAAASAKRAAEPIDDTRATATYRAAMVEVMVTRALEACC